MSRSTKPRRLGKGLSSLIGEPVEAGSAPPAEPSQARNKKGGVQPDSDESSGGLRSVPIDRIIPASDQPRQTFSESALAGLAESIKTTGVMQPIAIRPLKNRSNAPEYAEWELVAGERRWRAAKLAGLESVPAIISDLSDREAAEWSLVENLQRVDLNPMERAWAFRRLQDDFGLSHAEISQRVGLDRASVSNLVRLTDLESEIRDQLAEGSLSLGHGKALLAHPPGEQRVALARRAAASGWSVRRLETQAKSRSQEGHTASDRRQNTSTAEPTAREAERRDLERRVREALGAKVELRVAEDGRRGRLVIHFFDLDQFDGLLARLGVRSEHRG